MPSPRIPTEKQAEIASLLAKGVSHVQIANRTGLNRSTVQRYAAKYVIEAKPEMGLHAEIRKALKKDSHTAEELADVLDCGPSKIRQALEEMQASGAMLHEQHGSYSLLQSMHLEPAKHEVVTPGKTVLGITSDNHLCNKHARLDVLRAAYDHFEQRGITRVLNAGNWIDGEARFNKTELLTRPGMDAQLDYMIDNWPVKPGITTEYIAGDDHEGWYQQREGIEVGKYLQMRAEEQGRKDLKYLGYGECDIALRTAQGSAVMRLVHPGGGSSYAISYTDQKRVESYQGGEKPQIEVAGHYHKFNYGYPREVHTLQAGCTCDQTMFMRKKRLQAHVGYSIVTITQDERGSVTGFQVEWYPYFNRGYYEQRF